MAGQDRAPAAPPDLGEAGKSFWKRLHVALRFTDAELALLKQVCATLDALARLDEVVAADGVTTTGSAGQLVVHPAMIEARQQRVVLHRLVAALNLPDPEESAADRDRQIASANHSRAKVAAAARWAGGSHG